MLVPAPVLRACLRAAIAVSAGGLGFGLARPASAVDGVIEINHASALAGGVTAPDLPNYPVTLAGPGSFRLTGALAPPAGQHAIVITGSHVTLDLNGFSIRVRRFSSSRRLPRSRCTTTTRRARAS